MLLDIEIHELLTVYVDAHPALVVALLAVLLIGYTLHRMARYFETVKG